MSESEQERQRLVKLSLAKKALTVSQVAFVLPFAFLWKLAKSPIEFRGYPKPLKRRIGEILLQVIGTQFHATQMKFLFNGTTKSVYDSWAKSRNVDPQEDVIKHGGRLLWIGKRRKDGVENAKVLLYFHGGGYLLSAQSPVLDYWLANTESLEKSGKNIGVAVLAYSLSDEATYPVQLNQALAAIEHVLQLGYKPSDVVLAGDSAGGNLAFQVLLHLNLLRLRSQNTSEKDSIEPAIVADDSFEFPPDLKLRGVLGISPWFSVHPTRATTKSYEENRKYDCLSPEGSKEFGQIYAHGVPDSHKPHFDFVSTPKEWFRGLDRVVERILMTIGERETLRDDSLGVARGKIAESHKEATIVLQEFGTHNDVFLDVALGLDPPVHLAVEILEWLKAAFD